MPHYIGEKMKHTPESLQRRKVRSTVDWSSAGQILINFLCSRFPYRDRNGWISVIENGEISINGKKLDRPYLTYGEITAGGVLKFELSKEPCEDFGKNVPENFFE